MNLIKAIEKYKPFNEQEEKDKAEMLRRLKSGEELYTRDNSSAHITVSGWVVNLDKSRVLMAYHNIYDSWSWLGGHADGEKNLSKTALREVMEESGLEHVSLVSDEIFSLEILTVDGHVKRGEYVSSHLHLNITFLLEADDRQKLRCKPDENSGVKWFAPDDAVSASSEPWIRERIYRKLNAKVKGE